MTRGHEIAQALYPALKCDVCGTEDSWIERHHHDSNEFNNAPDNVLVCCRRCHMVVDGRIDRAVRRALQINQRKRDAAPTHCSVCEEQLIPGKIRNGMCKICDQRVRRRLIVGHKKPLSKPKIVKFRGNDRNGGLNRVRGTEHPSAKLTEDNVRYIRSSKETNAELARKFGVAWHSVDKIRKGLRWRHVK